MISLYYKLITDLISSVKNRYKKFFIFFSILWLIKKLLFLYKKYYILWSILTYIDRNIIFLISSGAQKFGKISRHSTFHGYNHLVFLSFKSRAILLSFCLSFTRPFYLSLLLPGTFCFSWSYENSNCCGNYEGRKLSLHRAFAEFEEMHRFSANVINHSHTNWQK